MLRALLIKIGSWVWARLKCWVFGHNFIPYQSYGKDADFYKTYRKCVRCGKEKK